MKKILLIALFIYIKQVNAQTWVTISDANFVTYLQSIIPSAMNGNQLNTSSTLVTTNTHAINVSNSNISNLNGIQYFSSLDTLYCYNNSLISLPTLPNSLQILYCNANSLTNLPSLPNSLTHLDCSQNSLNALPVLPISLTVLNCSSNSLTGLPSLPNSLLYLICVQDSLYSLPTLDNSLEILECQFNYLTTLPALPHSLRALNCSSNNITCFPYFPNSIDSLGMGQNLFNCLPNYIAIMGADTLQYPICSAGNTNGCIVVTGIQQLPANKNQLVIYPNPANKILNVELEKQSEITISDALGNEIRKEKINNNLQIDISDLTKGIYFIKSNSGGKIYINKFIKE